MKPKNHKQVAGKLSRLKQAVDNYASQASRNPEGAEAIRAWQEAEASIAEIETLIKQDPVLSKDDYIMGFPKFYWGLIENARSSRSLADSVISILDRDEKFFDVFLDQLP